MEAKLPPDIRDIKVSAS